MHWHCFLRMAWLNRREWYVLGELGGFWAWMRWWPTTLSEYKEYEHGICGYCDMYQLSPDGPIETLRYIFA